LSSLLLLLLYTSEDDTKYEEWDGSDKHKGMYEEYEDGDTN
jgi:hypothetical protein